MSAQVGRSDTPPQQVRGSYRLHFNGGRSVSQPTPPDRLRVLDRGESGADRGELDADRGELDAGRGELDADRGESLSPPSSPPTPACLARQLAHLGRQTVGEFLERHWTPLVADGLLRRTDDDPHHPQQAHRSAQRPGRGPLFDETEDES